MRLAALLAALLVSSAGAAGIDALRWEMRPLIVFAPAGSDPGLSRQLAALEVERENVRERRIAVYVVAGEAVAPALGAPPADVPAAVLRERFGVGPRDFRVVLVGLDGGTKLSGGEPVAAGRIFALIDGMPMRREELRRRD